MPRASYTQPGFLGGFWSPLAQGRFDQPFYKQAMNVNLNGIVVEEGPWVRRSGTEFLGPTYERGPAKLLPLLSQNNHPYLMEVTATSLRFYDGTSIVCTNDPRTIQTSSMSNGILSVTLDALSGWGSTDSVILYPPASSSVFFTTTSEASLAAATTIYVNPISGIYLGGLVSSGASGFPTGSVTVTSIYTNPAPAAPALTAVSGGSLAAETYTVVVTYTGAFGETSASPEATIVLSANYVFTVTSPAAQTGATHYNVYVTSGVGGSFSPVEQLQNASPIAIGTNWTMPTSGVLTGQPTPSGFYPDTQSPFTVGISSAILTGGLASGAYISFGPVSPVYASTALFTGRQLRIRTPDASIGATMTLADDLNNALPFNITTGDLNGCQLFRVLRFGVTYTTSLLPDIRVVQAQDSAFILSSGTAPQVVTVTDAALTGYIPVDSTFTYSAATFIDGPYLDPQGTVASPETGTVSAYTGSITFTPETTQFKSTDVGRSIRLFSQPAAYASGTTYTNGQFVTDSSGAWWEFTYSSGLAGVTPGTSTTIGGVTYLPWAPAPTAGQWAWGTITAEANTSCTVSLTTDLSSANGSTISMWQLGVYKAGQYPTCGVYHEGRLWLAGAVPNRFDASMTNDTLTFSPTDINNNVLDNSAISVTLNFDDTANIYWMIPDHAGILVGTNGAEVMISASQLNDPLTPTSIQAHIVSKYMSENVQPRRAGMAAIFAQRYQQRVIEHLADAFSGKFSGRHLNEFAKSLTAAGVKELDYQEEKAPIVWALMNDGSLAGCTYRRVSRFVTEPPVMQAWGTVTLGDSSTINAICVLPDTGGLSDLLFVSPLDSNGYYWVDVMRPIFEDA